MWLPIWLGCVQPQPNYQSIRPIGRIPYALEFLNKRYMKKKLSITHYKAIFLLSGCLLLLGLIYWEWRVFTFVPVKERSNASKEDKIFFDSLLDYQDNLLPKQEYENIVTSPLFIEGRIAIKHNDSSVVQGSSDFKLTGVILNADKLLALITDAKNNQFRLKVGEQANGWMVTSVQKDAVELRKDDQIQNLLLVEPKKISNSATIPNNFNVPPEQDSHGSREYGKPNFY
jgi:hypothetical protein